MIVDKKMMTPMEDIEALPADGKDRLIDMVTYNETKKAYTK